MSIDLINLNDRRKLFKTANIFHPKYVYHVDFNLYYEKSYSNFLSMMMSREFENGKNLITSIILNIGETEMYYYDWCKKVDHFFTDQKKQKTFDYLSIYINATENEMSDAWVNRRPYSSYQTIYDFIQQCIITVPDNIILNFFIIKKYSKKTAKPIYKNILTSYIDFFSFIYDKIGYRLPLKIYGNSETAQIYTYNQLGYECIYVVYGHSYACLKVSNKGIATIRHIHCDSDYFVELIEFIEKMKNRKFNEIQLDKRLIKVDTNIIFDKLREKYKLFEEGENKINIVLHNKSFWRTFVN